MLANIIIRCNIMFFAQRKISPQVFFACSFKTSVVNFTEGFIYFQLFKWQTLTVKNIMNTRYLSHRDVQELIVSPNISIKNNLRRLCFALQIYVSYHTSCTFLVSLKRSWLYCGGRGWGSSCCFELKDITGKNFTIKNFIQNAGHCIFMCIWRPTSVPSKEPKFAASSC